MQVTGDRDGLRGAAVALDGQVDQLDLAGHRLTLDDGFKHDLLPPREHARELAADARRDLPVGELATLAAPTAARLPDHIWLIVGMQIVVTDEACVALDTLPSGALPDQDEFSLEIHALDVL